VFVACKVEEFNVSINQFVNNIKGDRNKATDIVLSNELLLIGQLNYYLTIHNPFRPIEGFLIDIKVRYIFTFALQIVSFILVCFRLAAICRIQIVCGHILIVSLIPRTTRMPVFCIRLRKLHWLPSSTRPAESKRISIAM